MLSETVNAGIAAPLKNCPMYIINIYFLHIGPSSSRLSNAQAPVVPNVAHNYWNNNNIYESELNYLDRSIYNIFNNVIIS